VTLDVTFYLELLAFVLGAVISLALSAAWYWFVLRGRRMADPSSEASWLREHWHPDDPVLRQYRDQWIAVKGSRIVGSDQVLGELIAKAGQGPLYAFVFFGDMQ
jgi:Family of unknown function (DUF5678)